MLRDHSWRLKYTSEDGDLLGSFYLQALESAKRYDRITGYFNAAALALAARGIEGLVRNGGAMRLIVGCTLSEPEIEAIVRGSTLRHQVERHLLDVPLEPPDVSTENALELLAWMVARGHLDVKVAVPCDAERQPIGEAAIFHEKTGVIEDCVGDKIAWTGSLNETSRGWQFNWESIQVFRSWGPEPERVTDEDLNFARLWSNDSRRAVVLDIPEAIRADLLKFLPEDDLPERLRPQPAPQPKPPWPSDRARLVWTFIRNAPTLLDGGARTGEATAAITPWPHQVKAFERLYSHWPPRLLIADEVGLGKTIQAGLLLRQAWLSGRAKRILILAPKAVLKQWQIELREKFNLNWPIYDGRSLCRYESQALRGQHERRVSSNLWHEEPAVIVSSQLMRRKDRAKVLIEGAWKWDLVILDEAHHARRRAAGSKQEGGANALLRLMRALSARTEGLVLLTATPMQIHPIEVWDLMDLIGLPSEWSEAAFLDFFEQVRQPNPSGEVLDRLARMFQGVESEHGEVSQAANSALRQVSSFKAKKILRALRSVPSTPRRQLEPSERRTAVTVMRANTPIRHLISRNTRELLREYSKAGKLKAAIASRNVLDRFVEMSRAEVDLYDAIDEYISKTYNRAAASERSAVGFVMTIYRRRFASSFAALGATLEKRLKATLHGSEASLVDLEEDPVDSPHEEALDDLPDAEEVEALASQALAIEERSEIERLLAMIQALPPDSKLTSLIKVLQDLRGEGYGQVMIFTQYTDTMDFLRNMLRKRLGGELMCFSGRGGEIAPDHGSDEWRCIDRDQVKRRFKHGEADFLLCTDAAAEGLNFQFCGALVNYDMPWNPMRVEQRIGRIDRVGQEFPTVRVVNLHYKDTVEAKVYSALRERIDLFQNVVGRLQPILARMPGVLAKAVLGGRSSEGAQDVTDQFEREVNKEEQGGFDIDETVDRNFEITRRPPSPMTLDDLDRIIRDPQLMPPDTEVRPLGEREYSLLASGMQEAIRVTTDPDYYQQNSESVELWSPGNPFFPCVETLQDSDLPAGLTLKELLDG